MAEILPNSPNDVASRGVTNETLAQFKGLARQVVINIDDNFRPVIMDGLTLGGKSKVALVTDLKDYLPKDNPTFTGTLSGTNGTFTGTLSLKGDPVATQSKLLTEGPTLQPAEIDKALTSLGVYDALEDLITENGGTVPTSLSENSIQTISAQRTPADPWADLE